MPTFENRYEVVVITDAADAETARAVQIEALEDVSFDITFLGGDSA
jgi:hypothetical protein